MKGASVKKVILRFSSGNDPICHSQKFQPSQTPPSHFLPISPRFLTNIRCQYFSLNIWVVYDQLELDWCIFDQNWAKTRPLHFQIFQILNAIDRPIVKWGRTWRWAEWRGEASPVLAAWSSGQDIPSKQVGPGWLLWWQWWLWWRGWWSWWRWWILWWRWGWWWRLLW